jgi:hypothetical protein
MKKFDPVVRSSIPDAIKADVRVKITSIFEFRDEADFKNWNA